MAAIVIKDNAKATWLTGLAGVRAKARDIGHRAMACAAATVLICGVGAALLQLVAQILSFPAPIAVTAITLMAAALLNSLRRHPRYRPASPTSCRRTHRSAGPAAPRCPIRSVTKSDELYPESHYPDYPGGTSGIRERGTW